MCVCVCVCVCERERESSPSWVGHTPTLHTDRESIASDTGQTHYLLQRHLHTEKKQLATVYDTCIVCLLTTARV